jgi:phage tail-like protein
MPGVHQGSFLVEMDGVAALRATKVTGLKKTHEPFELQVGDSELTEYGRGKSKVEAVTIQHAFAINASGREVFQYFDDYCRGITTEKRSMRVVQLHEDGFTDQGVYELIDCVPKEFSPSDSDATGKDPAYWNIVLQPTDMYVLTDG